MNHLTDPQLNEYLDNTLNASARRVAELHLQTCEECSVRLGALGQVFESLAGLPEARLAHDLRAGVLARLPEGSQRLWTPLFAAQVGAALGLLTWLAIQASGYLALRSFTPFMTPVLATPDLYSLWAQIQIALAGLPVLSLPSLLSMPAFESHLRVIPDFHTLLPNLSSTNLGLLSVSISLLWLIGNATLLGNRNGDRR